MNDKIISIRSRKPLAEELAQKAEAEAETKELVDKARTDFIDRIRDLVHSGRLDGMIVIAKDSETGLFFNDVFFSEPENKRRDAFGYVGALETLKLEMADVACMQPILQSDGTVLDPYVDEAIDEFGDDE